MAIEKSDLILFKTVIKVMHGQVYCRTTQLFLLTLKMDQLGEDVFDVLH